MSTYFNDIQAALDTQLATISGSPDIAWEHTVSSPDGDYIRPTFLPGETVQACRGDDGQDLTNGIYQVDVFKVRGTGRSQQPDVIATLFKRGTYLTYNGITVRIVSSSIERSTDEENYTITPVSIRWQVFTPPRV
ncbi:MAG: phage tail terminator-like protein [Rickettsiales bacterium]